MLESVSGCADLSAARTCSDVAGPFDQMKLKMACWSSVRGGPIVLRTVTLRSVTQAAGETQRPGQVVWLLMEWRVRIIDTEEAERTERISHRDTKTQRISVSRVSGAD